MSRSGLPTVTWLLAGLIVIASGLISLGQQDESADPKAKSYGPSGVSAFAELLKRNGISVEISRESKPKLTKGDVAVAFKVIGEQKLNLIDDGSKQPEPFFDTQFWKFVENGGCGIILPLDKAYLDASQKTKEQPSTLVTDLSTHETFHVSTGGNLNADVFEAPEDDSAELELWKDEDASFLRAFSHGKGAGLIVRDALGVTNRFLDKEDNAKAFMAIFSILTKSHKRVVFTEASFGNINDPGLLEAIGPWANAAWQQLIFLGIVIVFTLGKRFGTPDDVRLPQRGARELLDGISDTFKRNRATQAALATALRSADADIRLVLKLPKDATRAERDRLVPASLQNALARLQVASELPRVSQDHALDLILKAQSELDAFVGPNRAKLRSLAKLRT